MSILAINSATTDTQIALITGQKVWFEKSWHANRDEAEKLIPALRMALEKVGKAGMIEGIAVIAGPGSFTGLRVGVAIANAFAYSQKIPMYSWNVFEYLRHRLPAQILGKTVIVVRGGGAFLAVKLPDKKNTQQVLTENFTEWLMRQKNIKYIYADLPADEKKLLHRLMKKNKVKFSFIPANRTKSFGKTIQTLLEENPKKQETIRPVYLQPPNITQSKKQVFVPQKTYTS